MKGKSAGPDQGSNPGRKFPRVERVDALSITAHCTLANW